MTSVIRANSAQPPLKKCARTPMTVIAVFKAFLTSFDTVLCTEYYRLILVRSGRVIVTIRCTEHEFAPLTTALC